MEGRRSSSPSSPIGEWPVSRVAHRPSPICYYASAPLALPCCYNGHAVPAVDFSADIRSAKEKKKKAKVMKKISQTHLLLALANDNTRTRFQALFEESLFCSGWDVFTGTRPPLRRNHGDLLHTAGGLNTASFARKCTESSPSRKQNRG
jgi:hypothetical protein